MMWGWLVRLVRQTPPIENGGAARRARAEAERKLAEARRMWPQTRQTHDRLAAWIEDALRGHP